MDTKKRKPMRVAKPELKKEQVVAKGDSKPKEKRKAFYSPSAGIFYK